MASTTRGWTTIVGRRESEPPERTALRCFQNAARSSPGYGAFLAERGVNPQDVKHLEQVPFTNKSVLFAGDVTPWIIDGRISDAAELITSSGASGSFSLGVISHHERAEQQRAIDATLSELGAGPGSSTLVLNCLPMGITLPTEIATVATPSVHVEVATELLVRTGPHFDRVVIASEPLFLKELGETALRLHGPRFARRVTACFVGGEWVAESWRRYVSSLFDFTPDDPRRVGVFVSLGAAEAGLHVLNETPVLRAVRTACDNRRAREALFGEDRGYTPPFFAWDPTRVHLEERCHDDGARTLAVTALEKRLLPLVRYDLEDEGLIIAPETLNDVLAQIGTPLRVDAPTVAVFGRRSAHIDGPGWSLRPEAVKENLFAVAAHAGSVTGRFRLRLDDGAATVHVQLRDGVRSTVRLQDHLADTLQSATGVPASVRLHRYRDYPFHDGGDFQRKPRYLE